LAVVLQGYQADQGVAVPELLVLIQLEIMAGLGESAKYPPLRDLPFVTEVVGVEVQPTQDPEVQVDPEVGARVDPLVHAMVHRDPPIQAVGVVEPPEMRVATRVMGARVDRVW
jgi:hypothetical protein